jgi:hypothetical protein
MTDFMIKVACSVSRVSIDSTNSNANLNSHEKEASLYTVIIIASHGLVVLQEPSVKVNNPCVRLCVCSTSLLFTACPLYLVGIFYEMNARHFIWVQYVINIHNCLYCALIIKLNLNSDSHFLKLFLY